jgi:hypothetical protein
VVLKLIRKVEELGVVDKLPQKTDSLQGLRFLSTEKTLNILRVDKVVV